ncbi:MAG: anthranilate phosphoribosyltransferase, partial [Myxococcales bacterium]|nr:anthranilate phosphoribosyltransferase [Myxococcales bacterium]
VLSGQDDGAHTDHLALNAAAALVVTDKAADLRSGVALAKELIRSGAAMKSFESYRSATIALKGDA